MYGIQSFTEIFKNVNSKYFFENFEKLLMEKKTLFFYSFDKLKERNFFC